MSFNKNKSVTMEIIHIGAPRKISSRNFGTWKILLCASVILALVEQTVAYSEKRFQQRLARSPQMPPSVTARRPSSFEDLPPFRDDLDVKPGVQSSISAPPSVMSRTKSKENTNSSSAESTYFKASNNLPVSPFIAAKTMYDVDESSETQIFVLHTQSDESEDPAKAEAKMTSTSGISNSLPKERDDRKQDPKFDTTTKSPVKFSNYLEALKSVKVSPPKAASILKRKGVAFAEFINFIEGGATRDQILQILYVPEMKEIEPRPDLTNYFTEIVHEVPTKGSYKNYESEILLNESKQHKTQSKDFPKKKGYKKKRLSKKQKFHGDINDLPSKDSPMIAHRRKANEGTASILSVSIEEKKKKTPPKKKEVEDPKKNVLLPSKPQHKLSASERLEKVEPADLRVVLPIKGILLFCSVVGGVALLITLFLAIYTALNCSKGDVENTYTMNTADRPEEVEV